MNTESKESDEQIVEDETPAYLERPKIERKRSAKEQRRIEKKKRQHEDFYD